MLEDLYGNRLSTTSTATLAGVDDFIGGFLGYETRATNVLAAADGDPDSLIANVYAGFTWMFLEAAEAPERAGQYLVRAERLEQYGTPREKLLLEQLRRWVSGDIDGVLAIGSQIVAEHPRDLVSVKLHQYHAFNRGDAEAMLRIAEAALPANPDDPHIHGMRAFGLEQLHRIPEAETAARQALKLKRKEPWAQHALAHVMLSTGRVREGAAFLSDMADTWGDLNSFMYTHNWWHRALFDISLGNAQAVLDAYDAHVWSREKGYSQDQVNAISLLARMEIAGIDVGDRWAELAQWLKPRAKDTLLPFLTVQYLYGLARAGLGEADTLMAAIADRAATARPYEAVAWREVALPMSRDLLAHARGRPAEAVPWLELALPRLQSIGGSHAQRDLFGQILLDAHMKAGNWAAARQLLEMRRTWDPDGVPLRRAIAEADSHLAQPV